MSKIAIITGASSGLGDEFARQLDRKFKGIDEFWLVARRTDRLEALANELNKPCQIITADLSFSKDIDVITNMLVNEKPDVKMLINCAGFGKIGDFMNVSQEFTNGMIDVNCRSLTDMVYRILPYMHRKSVIINIASSAAFMPQPGFAVYAASKSYVLSFTRGLRREVARHGIRVTAVCPGPVRTEFFDIAEDGQAVMWYKKFVMADADKVVSKAISDAMQNKELSIYGLPMNVFYIFTKIIPHRVILKIMTLLNNIGNK